MTALAPGDLVDLVHEDDPGLLDPLNRHAGDALHVDQLLLLFLEEVVECLGDLHPTFLGAPLEESREHVLDVDVDFLHRRPGDDFEGGEGLLADVDLHQPFVETSVA